TAAFTVNQPDSLSVNADVTSATCTAANGSISLQVNGGTGSYSYVLDNNQNSFDINNLAVRTYTSTISDIKNCTSTVSAIVNSTGAIIANTATSNVLCNGAQSGSATVNVVNGTAPYIYTWSNGASSAAVTNLAASTYSVTVIDANNCSTILPFAIT